MNGMDGKIKAALVVGGALLLLNLGSGLVCQLCPLTLSLMGGAMAGWQAVLWTGPPARYRPPAGEGAIGGLQAAIGGFVGQVIATIVNSVYLATSDLLDLIAGQPLTDREAATISLIALAIWGCVGVLTVAASVGLAALTAKLAAARRNQRNPL